MRARLAQLPLFAQTGTSVAYMTPATQRLYRRLQIEADMRDLRKMPWSTRVPRPLDQKYRILPRMCMATTATMWKGQEYVIGGGWEDMPGLFPTPAGVRRAILQMENANANV